MIIEVTQQDIDEGRRCAQAYDWRSQTCPIAQACKRHMREDLHRLNACIRVAGKEVCIVNALSSMVVIAYYNLPLEASAFISKFDRELPVQPFTFELDVK